MDAELAGRVRVLKAVARDAYNQVSRLRALLAQLEDAIAAKDNLEREVHQNANGSQEQAEDHSHVRA